MKALLVIVGCGVAVSSTPLLAQDTSLTRVDYIAAIVGEDAIPYSRVEEQFNVLRSRGVEIPKDSATLQKMRHDIIEQLVDDQLLVRQAQRDTAIKVTDEQVQKEVDAAIRQVRTQFRSDVDFEREMRTSGFRSIDEYRRWVADQRRRDLLQQALYQRLQAQGVLRPIPPTEAEMREAFDQEKAQRGLRPAIVSFRQVIVVPKPDSAALVKARRLADSLVVALRNGADFATVAKRFSDDPASRDQGGELGWFRRGQMVPAFDQVAFSIKPGYISPPVLSPYGYHIIEVERSEPAEVQARHILIAPDISPANEDATRALADSIVRLARNGASFDSLARIYQDPAEPSFAQGVIQDSLPPEYRTAIADAKEGDIVGPVPLEDPNRPTRWAALRIEELKPAGPYTYEELREQIRQALTRQSALRRYLDELREKTYIDIRVQ